ncbi:MAG: transaldolase [Xanthomonadales bacterium]|nr:transaldolase [Xanthomonadales bacterium]
MAVDNPLTRLAHLGQSIWLDYIRRDLLQSGELKRMIESHGLAGMTSNPAIFEKAIAGSDQYQQQIAALARQGYDAEGIYRNIALEDVGNAADCFRSVYDRTDGLDGYVSLEVSPHLARDTEQTIVQARELWDALDRPNVMIKVPGTVEGLPAIEQLTAEGINVNVTLLFSVKRYEAVVDAFLCGLEKREQSGEPLSPVASVASFFVSRVDTAVDKRLETIYADQSMFGKAAVANARIAYDHFRHVTDGERWRALAAHGARPQRLLWASTSTKNPDYPDVKYVEALIGPETVNTLPPATYDAYLDHGDPQPRLGEDLDRAHADVQRLQELRIDLEEVAAELEEAGVEAFADPYDQLLDTIEEQRLEALGEQGDLGGAV